MNCRSVPAPGPRFVGSNLNERATVRGVVSHAERVPPSQAQTVRDRTRTSKRTCSARFTPYELNRSVLSRSARSPGGHRSRPARSVASGGDPVRSRRDAIRFDRLVELRQVDETTTGVSVLRRWSGHRHEHNRRSTARTLGNGGRRGVLARVDVFELEVVTHGAPPRPSESSVGDRSSTIRRSEATGVAR